MEFLNEYSGLFSLLAVVASVVAIVVSVVIFNKQKKRAREILLQAEKRSRILPSEAATRSSSRLAG